MPEYPEDSSGGFDASDSTAEEMPDHDFGFRRAAAKVREFPQTPGVYLLKDLAGRVIYVGKAKNLRSRASSYFSKTASEEARTAYWVSEICDADFVQCDSEVDALLMESRLIKDVQPKYNKELKDDKTFPYLMITTREDFPRVEATREPRDRGVKLFGPFANAGALRGAIQVLQKIFKFRTCSLDIDEGDERWRWVSPLSIGEYQPVFRPMQSSPSARRTTGGISNGFSCSWRARRHPS